MAMPGLLLTGWAPARAAVRPVQLRLHDIAHGMDAEALRAGVELGLEDVRHAARMLQVPLLVHRGADATAPGGEQAVQIVVSAKDDQYVFAGSGPCAPRVYTCALNHWRPEAWSVASRPVPCSAGPPRLDWHPTLDTPAASQLGARFAHRYGIPMTEPAWRGWMAAKAAFEIALRAGAGEDDPLVLRLDGHKGEPLRFSDDGHLVQPTCRVVAGRAFLAPPADHDRLVDAG